ncbi:L,D-transpeptidase family protein [Jannaschia pohangensis]|uniref:L,D-peptidoglycan transpeptidase YkuD, ErfK/YbiS/YcfS/YnhG family n=1 Tax=Jannaschia pohangensis TaxID=390807 RepID=A0A1I3UBS4_9RHOB|nr:L,D-transpeptidase family protein [Jannaschia pohangensis]SFJ80163.1 L,D-peptidoglycan transpeptidase YkuD, ErfK/YbiS/YcfS/YnhG family [Jannaschia pohangensis]
MTAGSETTTPDDLVLTPGGVRFQGRLFPCSIGKGGRREDKREGDGATPVGVHGIVGMLYRPDRMARPADWALPIRPGDLWCDDPAHEDYNLMVRAPFDGSAERLWRADRLYDLIILTDWNWPRAEYRRGSAIFLHRWRRPGFATEGCVAFDPGHLRWIAARIRYRTRLIVR